MISRVPNTMARYEANAVHTEVHVDRGVSPGI